MHYIGHSGGGASPHRSQGYLNLTLAGLEQFSRRFCGGGTDHGQMRVDVKRKTLGRFKAARVSSVYCQAFFPESMVSH